jgi:hypothetical protein
MWDRLLTFRIDKDEGVSERRRFLGGVSMLQCVLRILYWLHWVDPWYSARPSMFWVGVPAAGDS